MCGAVPEQSGAPPAAGDVVFTQLTESTVIPVPNIGASVKPYDPAPPVFVTVIRYATGFARLPLTMVFVTVMAGGLEGTSLQAFTVAVELSPALGVTVAALFKPPELVVTFVKAHSPEPAVFVTALLTVNGMVTVYVCAAPFAIAVPSAARVLLPVAVVQFGVPPAAGAVVFTHVMPVGVRPLPKSGVSVKPYVPGPPVLVTVTRYTAGLAVATLVIDFVTRMFGGIGVHTS